MASGGKRIGLLSSIGSRAFWTWRERRAGRAVGFGWAILPMVIILVVLSVYGLSYFAMGKSWLRRAFSAVSHPESARAEKILPGVNASIGERKVVVDKKIPFRIIRNIMHAAEATGYTEIQLVVVPKEPHR